MKEIFAEAVCFYIKKIDLSKSVNDYIKSKRGEIVSISFNMSNLITKPNNLKHNLSIYRQLCKYCALYI